MPIRRIPSTFRHIGYLVIQDEFINIPFRHTHYVWPAILLLGLDRFLRIIRVVAYNFGYFTSGRPKELDAHVDVLSPDFLRITLYRPKHLHWTPGQSAYISMPGIAPFQSHPFTISTIDDRAMPLTKYATEDQLQLSSYEKPMNVKKLAFLIRVRKGFTGRLLNAAQDNQPLKVFFEGPYCSPPLLKGYDTVVLIASMLLLLAGRSTTL